MMASIALLILLLGLAVLASILFARWSDMTTWRHSLVAYQLHPPKNLSADDVGAWLSTIQAMTHPMRFSLMPLPPVCFEVVSSSRGINFFVLVAKSATPQLLSGLRSSMPGARISEASEYKAKQPKWLVAAELTMTNHERPLAIERAQQTSSALLASLQPTGNAEICIQWILTSAGTSRPVPTPRSSSHSSIAWSWENTLPQDAEAVQAARAKIRDSLLMATARVSIAAENKAAAYALFSRVWNNFHAMNAVGVRLRRRILPSDIIADRLTKRTYPITRWPLLVSSKEGAGLLALPLGGVSLPGLALGSARQLPPPANMSTRGLVLGVSNYVGLTTRPITLQTEDRLRHMAIIAPTGSGKSWLLTQMILQDIDAGRGTIVVDPKGDLITDVLGRIQAKDAERVVVIDANQRDQPIGLNILGGGYDESSRELVVDNILSVFRSIWSDFWGPRSDSICRAVLTTLTLTHGVDGSVMTLCEMVPLLTDPAFRRFVVSQPGLPDTLRAYWQRYDNMSEGERNNSIAPLIHKIEAFTSRTPIRLMLGQAKGFDLREIFWHRKVVLISLAKGSLGSETANLLGSLLISLLWQATLARINTPQAQRHPCFAYIDEAADIMKLSLPLAEIFSQARGLGLGMITANQIFDQIPQSIRATLLGTVRTQLSFAVEHEDSVLLAPRFAPLTTDDLQGLLPWEAALRPCVDGVTRSPVTLKTLPLADPIRDSAELAVVSRERYGLTRSAVEESLRKRIVVTAGNSSVGRRRRGGGSP